MHLKDSMEILSRCATRYLSYIIIIIIFGKLNKNVADLHPSANLHTRIYYRCLGNT